jgi:hypothetical protein
MKRGFLFGLGTFLVICALAGLAHMLRGEWQGHIDAFVGILTFVVCAPLSVCVLHSAMSAPVHRSRLHAVVGWIVGFCIVNAVVLGAAS